MEREGNSQLEEDIKFIEKHLKEPFQFTSEKDKNVVILLGTTGTGKTTFSAYLSGQNLVVKQNDCGEFYLDYRYPSKDGKGKIGQSMVKSETTIPNKFTPISTQSHQADFSIWDCPGFEDSRGPAQDIVNSTYIAQIFRHAERVKFILLIDSTSFDANRGELLKSVLESMLFFQHGTSLDFSKNMLIVFTKTKLQEKFQKIKFEKFLNQLEQMNTNSETFKTFMKNFFKPKLFDQLKKAPIAMFPQPSVEDLSTTESYNEFGQYPTTYRQDFLKKINELKPLHINNKPNAALNLIGVDTSNYLHAPFSIRSYDTINALWNKKREEIKSNFSRICLLIKEDFQTIKKKNESSFIEVNKLLTDLISMTSNSNETFITTFTNLVKKYFFVADKLNNNTILDDSVKARRNEILNLLTNMQHIGTFYYDGLFRNFTSMGKEINKYFGCIGDYELLEGRSYILVGQKYLNTLFQQKKDSFLSNDKNTTNFKQSDVCTLSGSQKLQVQTKLEKIRTEQKKKVNEEMKCQQDQAFQKGNTLTDPSKNYVASGVGGAVVGAIATGIFTGIAALPIGVGAIIGGTACCIFKFFGWL